jgi:hypothetical protein
MKLTDIKIAADKDGIINAWRLKKISDPASF